MASKKTIADDIFKKHSALLSQKAISEYTGFGREKVRQLVNGLPHIGNQSGKRYFYMDVAEKLIGG